MDINQKIAEWAGFVEKGSGYVWPDGRYDKTPDFTDPEWGIAHLFKWAVPKFGKDVYILWQHPYGEPDTWLAEIHDVEKLVEYIGQDQEPAIALCYAVEKLIDREVKDGRT